jgi:hypothetical protein
VVIECYDILKSRFPFSKVSSENTYGGNNVWGKNSNGNYGGGGFINPNTGPGNNWNGNNNNANWGTNNNNNWGNNAGNNGWETNNVAWGANNANTNPSPWGNNSNPWDTNKTNPWGNNNTNPWGANNQTGGTGGMGAIGGMGGIINSTAQKFTVKQKQTLTQLNVHYTKLLDKTQVLDATKQSL